MWKCTNPSCRADLSGFAKIGKSTYTGCMILTCEKCGFEFAIQAVKGTTSSLQKGISSKTKFDYEIAALKKKIKSFDLS